MGDFTSVSLTVTCSSPALALRVFEVLDVLCAPGTLEGWREKYPEAAKAADAGLWLPQPKGEYCLKRTSMTDGDDAVDVCVELSSERTPNARFQASAVITLARAVDPRCSVDASLSVPEDYTVEPGDEDPFWSPFERWVPVELQPAGPDSTVRPAVDYEALEKFATEFVTAIDVTGGLNVDDCPVGDPEWLDLGSAYLGVCRALGRSPMSTSGTTHCALCDKLIWARDSWSPHDEAICAECDTEVTGRDHPPSVDPRTDPEPGGTGQPLGIDYDDESEYDEDSD